MTIEVRAEFSDLQKEKPRFSSHPQLDHYLRGVDRLMPELNGEGVGVSKVPGLLGFTSDEARMTILGILHQIRGHKLFRINSFGPRKSLQYERKHLLLTAATVQFWAEGVTWSNMPYVLYHYVTNEQLREAINQPGDPYDPERTWKCFSIERRQERFSRFARRVFLGVEPIDLSFETILSDIPKSFYLESIKIKKDESDLCRELKPDLALERLESLYLFLASDSPIRPPQMDLISGTRLSLGGFTQEEAIAVFEEYARLKGDSLSDDSKTYLALKRAVGFIWHQRKNNTYPETVGRKNQ